jgi:dinuclear metal center YbgI/SA1388 family protein
MPRTPKRPARGPKRTPKPAPRRAATAARTVGDLAAALEATAPARLAEGWDNVGLLLGSRAAPCARVMLAIDLTPAVLDEAIDLGVDAVVAYHPPIFDPLKRLVADDPRQRVLLDAAQAGIALLSPHTALDAVQGGVNDWLAEGVAGGVAGLARATALEPLRPAASLPRGEAFKLVTFVPAESGARVRGALADAGAGRIGAYDHCTTRADVVGTFRGGPGTRPAVGEPGRVQEVREERIETVVAATALPWALAALRAVHPYEEPAIEVHALAARPSLDDGAGRLVGLRVPATAKEIAARLRRHLGCRRIELAAPAGAHGALHARVAVCAGAGMSLLPDALARGATLFVTGEARHHDQLGAVAGGCSLLLAGHTVTERGYLPRLAERLAPLVPGVSLTLSKADAHPLVDA